MIGYRITTTRPDQDGNLHMTAMYVDPLSGLMYFNYGIGDIDQLLPKSSDFITGCDNLCRYLTEQRIHDITLVSWNESLKSTEICHAIICDRIDGLSHEVSVAYVLGTMYFAASIIYYKMPL